MFLICSHAPKKHENERPPTPTWAVVHQDSRAQTASGAHVWVIAIDASVLPGRGTTDWRASGHCCGWRACCDETLEAQAAHAAAVLGLGERTATRLAASSSLSRSTVSRRSMGETG